MPSGGGRGGGKWGQTGLDRLFSGEFGTQISWLAPLAFAGIVISLLVIGRAVRTDVRRASVIAFGGWLTVTWLVFSFMAGIFHQYYTVALAPALASMVAIGALSLWNARDKLWARIVTPILIAYTVFWDFSLGSVPVASLAEVGHSHNRSHGCSRLCSGWAVANTTTRSCCPHSVCRRAYGWPCCMDVIHRSPRTHGINRPSRTQPHLREHG